MHQALTSLSTYNILYMAEIYISHATTVQPRLSESSIIRTSEPSKDAGQSTNIGHDTVTNRILRMIQFNIRN